jgi:hypothetical protein
VNSQRSVVSGEQLGGCNFCGGMLGAEKLQETMETVVESCNLSQCRDQGRAVHVEKVYTLEHGCT